MPNGLGVEGLNGSAPKASGFLHASFDDVDESSSLRGSEDASTIMGADDEMDAQYSSEEDESKEGKALLADVGEQVPRLDEATAERLEATVRVASPVDFSRGAIVRPALMRNGIAEAFDLSSSPVAGPSSRSEAALESNQHHVGDDSRFSSSGSEEESDPNESTQVHDIVVAGMTEDKRQSIKFHDTVRIHGGIKRQKRRRRRRPANALPREGHPHAPRAPSPLRDLFSDLKPTPPLRPPPTPGSYFDSPSGLPSGSGFHSPASAGRNPSGPLSTSPALTAHAHLFTSNRSRRPSSTMSFRDGYGSGYGSGFASVMTSATQSRSSSPASSIYAPLRMPAVRAPAPFFGPTPERLTRMKEKKEAARREAERAKGGWRSWWFGESRKAAAAAVEDDDEENAPCYHDVIIEHERNRLQRRLGRVSGQYQPPHHQHHHAVPQEEEHKEQDQGFWWKFWRRRPAPPDEEAAHAHAHHHHHHHHRGHGASHGHLSPHPIHGPLPSPAPRGRPLHRTRSALLGSINPSLPDVSEDEVVDSSAEPSIRSVSAAEADAESLAPPRSETSVPTSKTPLLSGRPTSAPSSSSKKSTRSCCGFGGKRRRRSKPKTEVFVRFGPAPRRWIKAAWWRWRWRLVRRWVADKVEGMKEAWAKWHEEDWEEGDGPWQSL